MMEVRLVDHMGSDLSVVNAARVSFAKESEWDTIPEAGPVESLLQERDEKLIKFANRVDIDVCFFNESGLSGLEFKNWWPSR